MLGSREMAENSETWFHGNVVVPRPENSNGYKVLGNGVSRTAILCPDGIVYKVSRGSGQSENEARFFEILDEFEIRWRPQWTYYDGVMAMPKYEFPWLNTDTAHFVDGYASFREWLDESDPDNRKRWDEMGKVVSDLHHHNVAVDSEGMLVLIDGGFTGFGDDRMAIQRLVEGSGNNESEFVSY